MDDTATSPAHPDPRPDAAAEIDRLSMLLLARLSSKRPPKKAPSQRDVTADVGRIVNRSGGGAEWAARVAAALEALHRAGLIERRPLRLTEAGVEALRRAFGVARAPTWDELPALLAARALDLDPEAPEARAAVRSTENLSALILARRFRIDERRGMGGVIDELTARELGVSSKGLNTDRLRARVLARHLGLPEKASVDQFIDGLITERLGLPHGKVDWVKLRKAVLARAGGTTTTGEPVQVATRIAAATVRVPKPDKRAMMAGLAQRWLDGVPLAGEPGAEERGGPAPEAAKVAPAGPNGQAAPHGATDPQAFARAVRAAAAEVTGDGRFGDRRVFIAALWRRVAEGELAGLTLADFKRRLLEANQAGDLSLARADLVDAMDPALVAESEIRDLGSSFHFVMDEPR